MATNIKTVLYVEDEESDRFFMELAFTKEGLERALQTVEDGQDAIDYLQGNGNYSDRVQHPIPCLILLDMNLPEVPGLEVLRWVRSNPDYKSLPVVVFSSSLREEDKRDAKALGADEFWQKPNSGSRFVEVINALSKRWPLSVQ
ncbi:MAG TPA: response regulator [Verrucomicrobiae bacterium]|nr:response regulator [Verrucomicrobiae bacterium]